jgi:hypothetical protein
LNRQKKVRAQKIIAWIAISISAAFANFWTYWGINENFHEGWYFVNFWDNVALMFGQYLLIPLGFMLLTFISVRWNKVGSVFYLLVAVASYFLFGKMNAGFFLVFLPLTGLGLLYWFGKPGRRVFAYFLVIGLPLIQIFGIGTYHALRISNRYNDNQFGIRLIEGNDLNLIWAPQGPGWPDNGTSWYEAKRICAHLNKDGTKLEENEVNIWRLPTVDEAVRSMVHHGNNAGGVWNNINSKATYNFQPDKESPLWNMHLKTIYWWTSTEVDDSKAYIIVYNGGVWPRNKSLKAGYLNFRAVKNTDFE